MTPRTTISQRQSFFRAHQNGETYQAIADRERVSKWTVRAWCRRQRDGRSCETRHRRHPAGQLARFDPKVPYCILRLRRKHPRWGPNRILHSLRKRPSLAGLALPSEASIGRYLHQWPCFRRKSHVKPIRERPLQPTEVHQRWQIDFKLGLALKNGSQVNLLTARDPMGEACIGARVSPAGRVGRPPTRVTLQQVQDGLRTCFDRWGTLPDEVQTDGEPLFIGRPQDPCPSLFTLWLRGLGIEHIVIRAGKPTDNAEVERCHRTVCDYAVVGNEGTDLAGLQAVLDQAVYELNHELSSRAEGCHGLAPVEAHPALLQPRQPFRSDCELVLFDLNRVDAYLATIELQRKVETTGQVNILGRRYSVHRSYAGREVEVRFQPEDRHFAFYDPSNLDEPIVRRPCKGLEVVDLTGLATAPASTAPLQLALPLFFSDGYVVNEQ